MRKIWVLTFGLLMGCAVKEPAPIMEYVVPMEDAGFVDVKDKYASDYERLVNNVNVKFESPVLVVYEYKDVRIDEVGLLAARYCAEQGHGGAVLREAVLTKNFYRRAAFDCAVLQ